MAIGGRCCWPAPLEVVEAGDVGALRLVELAAAEDHDVDLDLLAGILTELEKVNFTSPSLAALQTAIRPAQGASASQRIAHLRRLLAPLSVPVYLLAGNHDEPMALRAAFADHAYLPPNGPLYYAVDLGPLRLIALGDPLGRQFFPDAPMIGDTVPGFETYAWFGLCGPTGTAPAAIKRWEEAMKATVEDPAIAKRLLDNGMVPAFADSATLNKTIDENRRTYRAVIQAAGIKAE